jgi:hypothetical protein
MKKCLNIPTTEQILWNKIVAILSDNIRLKEILKEKVMFSKNFNSSDLEKIIKDKDIQIAKLIKVKNDLEKGLSSIEIENILNKYPSSEVYKSIKKDLTHRYNQTLSEIEDIKNSLKQIGNDNMWFDWIDRFSEEIKSKRELNEPLKKELLKTLINKIMVEYDHNEMIHILTINFKIPVYVTPSKEALKTSKSALNPLLSVTKAVNQNKTVGNYSTVTDLSSNSNIADNVKGYSLMLLVELKCSNLWLPSYSDYQQKLFDIITKYHEEENWNFKQISDWLNQNDFKTLRGCSFRQAHVWSIYQKKNRSIQRFSRAYDHKIKDMKIDIVDYIPISN